MSGWQIFGLALAVCAAIIAAKPLIFRGLDRISGRSKSDG